MPCKVYISQMGSDFKLEWEERGKEIFLLESLRATPFAFNFVRSSSTSASLELLLKGKRIVNDVISYG